MAMSADPAEVYRSIGVTPIITASGSTTAYGGSKLRPEVMETMNQAATVMVNIDELNLAAGKIIAQITQAEAGFVCSGASGGLVLQAAAVIAGSDPQIMARLPNTEGLSNEIIIHRSHRFPYDQCYAAAGAKLVEIGDGRRCAPWQLEAGFSDRTTAVAYLFSPFVSRRAIPFPQVCEIAQAHQVPVIVDAASFVPPRANLRRFIAEGADLVVYSGGKAIRGPQGTGILCGRADLIEAAAANASPHQFLGRGFKVAKEEVIGLIRSLQIFVSEDEEAETRHYRRMCQEVVDAFVETPGLDVSLEHDEYDYLIPHAVINFTKGWQGPSPAQVYEAMVAGDPPVYLHNLGNPENLAVDPLNLSQDELEITIHRLREVLLK
jgi:D-glucosaminate-6-phosphate ammonia-lyase